MVRFFLLFFAALFLFSNCNTESSNASSTYGVNSTLFVHAGKGLILKKAPDPQSEQIDVLSYGDQLEVLDSATGPLVVTEAYGPYKIAGNWLKVKAPEDIEGFTLKQYLFPLKPTYSRDNDGSFFVWFIKNYFPEATSTSQSSELANLPENATGGQTVSYSNNVTYQFAEMEQGFSEQLQIPSDLLSLEHALVFFRSALFPNSKIITQFDKDQGAVLVSDQVATLTLKNEAEILIIKLNIGGLNVQ